MWARKKDSGIVHALKIMDKKFITKEKKTTYVKLERIVLDQLDHPGIVRLFFTFQDSFSLCRYSWLKFLQAFNISILSFALIFLLNHVLSLPCLFSFILFGYFFFSQFALSFDMGPFYGF